MSEHTKGRLAYQEHSDAYTHILRDEGGGFILQLSQDTTGKSEANARRIAACWNAFDAACMTTPMIEKLVDIGGVDTLSETTAHLTKELAAARALLREVTKATNFHERLILDGRIRSYLDAAEVLS